MNQSGDRRRYARCSFCGKGQDQVRKLIAGPDVFICDQCIELCLEALQDDSQAPIGPQTPELTARELQVAILFAHRMDIKAIARCISLNRRAVEAHVMNAHRKTSSSPHVPTTSSFRRELRDWLSERGLLPDRSVSEAVLIRAISALESAPNLPDSLSSGERESMERHLAEEKALLEKALRAMRMED